MKTPIVDIVIVGAGPVGLMSAYLAQLCGLSTIIVDKSTGPLEAGRADALNARTLQLLEVANLFSDLYPLGKPCNTSSIWADGKFISRQSKWWDELEGCMHKHFLMIGQSYLEQLLDKKLQDLNAAVIRETSVEDLQVQSNGCITRLSNGKTIQSKYVIGADGARSFIREKMEISFEVTRPQMVWAVLDGIIETDFPKAPEIVVFQAETSDVAWIPREGNLDRFYVRMDTKDFTQDQAIAKINNAMKPHTLSFKQMTWFSQFSVKESVAEKFQSQDRVFLAGDACHIHSVNGGQGLNTGLADAFNLIWKLNMVETHGADRDLLKTYEAERKPVALNVVETSGELVRATKFSEGGTHATDYLKIVERRAGNITGMGIRYSDSSSPSLAGQRLFDFEVAHNNSKTRIYSLLDYTQFTLLVFGEATATSELPSFAKVLHFPSNEHYRDQVLLVRPDAYIQSVT